MPELTYRNLRASDVEALHQIVSDWAVVRQLGGWPWPAERDFTASRCKPYEGDGFVWGVFEAKRLVGTIGVTGGDIGYMYAPDVGARGIATTAARDAIAHAFDTTDRAFLTGATWHDNPSSYRILRKLGYKHWQTRYVRAKARRYPDLSYFLRLTRSDWERLRSARD